MDRACLNGETAPCEASCPGGVALTFVPTVSLTRFVNKCVKMRHSYMVKRCKVEVEEEMLYSAAKLYGKEDIWMKRIYI